MRLYNAYKDLDEAFIQANLEIFLDHDFINGNGHVFNIRIEAESDECSLNLGELGYTTTKWNQLVKKYFDPSQFMALVRRSKHYLGTKKRMKYMVDLACAFKDRDNVSGACLLSMMIGIKNNQWTVTINSRATELTIRWAADIIFIHELLKLYKRMIGIPETTPFQIIWNVGSAYQSSVSMALFLTKFAKYDLTQYNAFLSQSDFMDRIQKRFDDSYINKKSLGFAQLAKAVKTYENYINHVPDKIVEIPPWNFAWDVIDQHNMENFDKKLYSGTLGFHEETPTGLEAPYVKDEILEDEYNIEKVYEEPIQLKSTEDISTFGPKIMDDILEKDKIFDEEYEDILKGLRGELDDEDL